jgi:Thioesterase-like superfamily
VPDAEAFYLPTGPDQFRATEHTVGPWAPTDQHGGPPSALLVRAIERLLPDGEGMLARIAVDLVGPVPVAEVTVAAREVRPGRSVRLVEAEMSAGGRVVARATAWWHRVGDTGAVAEPAPAPPQRPAKSDRADWAFGYLDAIEWRWVRGHFTERGPANVWVRQRVPVLPDEEPSPTQRVMVIADSGNGVSNVLPMDSWLFVNTELTVHLFRPPVGEWLNVAAETTVGADGIGLAATRLSDDRSEFGRGAQALVVRPR